MSVSLLSTKKAEYAYDAYGNCAVLIDEGGLASLNPFRYRGYYFDSETGLYYLNARYYDPRIGRFLSPDGLPYLDPSAAVGMNLYAYCQCDPVNKADPTGHFVLPRAIDIKRIIASIGLKAKGLFGWEYRTSSGWEASESLHSSFIGRIGVSSYTTAVKGDGGIFYAFAGTTSDVFNLLGTNYYAGVGFNFGDVFGAEIQFETLGMGASVTLFGFTLSLDINLLGNISITFGRTIDSGNGTNTTTGVTIGINIGTILWWHLLLRLLSPLEARSLARFLNCPKRGVMK